MKVDLHVQMVIGLLMTTCASRVLLADAKCSIKGKVAEFVDEYLADISGRDIDEILKKLTDDAVFFAHTFPAVQGKADIEAFLELAFSAPGDLDIGNVVLSECGGSDKEFWVKGTSNTNETPDIFMLGITKEKGSYRIRSTMFAPSVDLSP